MFYKNNYAINLGLVSDKTTDNFISEGETVGDKVRWYDHFQYQNQIFKTFVNNYEEDIFIPLTITSFSTTVDYEVDEFGIVTYKNVKDGDQVTIDYKVPTAAYKYPLYFSEKECSEDAQYFLNGKTMLINTYWHNGIKSFKDTGSHHHSLVIRFVGDHESIVIRPELYYENLDIAKKYLSYLKDNSFVVKKINNNLTSRSYEGEMDVKENNKDLVFTLPYESGIRVYVDGKYKKAFTKWNIFTGIDLSDVEVGTHNIRIEYQDIPFTLSLPIAITSILGLIPLVIFYDKIELLLFKKRKKEEK